MLLSNPRRHERGPLEGEIRRAPQTQAGQSPSPGGAGLLYPRAHPLAACAAISSASSIRSHTLPLPWGSPPSTPDTPPAPSNRACPCCLTPRRSCCPTTAASSKPTSPSSLKERGIQRWYTYPKTPKMNAHAERFHRTIHESFVDDHEELLFNDLALFNRKLADWLVFDNASASAPHPRPAFPAILPPATSTRVPKVLDPYIQESPLHPMTLILCLNAVRVPM